MISKVLVAVKPGYLNPTAVKQAKLLAKELKYDLLLYSAVHENPVATSKFRTAKALQSIENTMLKAEHAQLEEIKSHFIGLCSSVSVRADWQKSVAQGIINAAGSFEADLIVLSGTVHGSLARLILGRTNSEVIFGAKVPVLVSQNPSIYKNLLAAVDPNHEHNQLELLNKNILAVSKLLRIDPDGELYLGHVYPPREDSSIEACVPPIDEFASWQALRHAAMEKLAVEHGVDLANTRQSSDSPANGIAKMARALKSDLVVMGALPPAFRKEQSLETTAETALRKLDCDVVFVPLPEVTERSR